MSKYNDSITTTNTIIVHWPFFYCISPKKYEIAHFVDVSVYLFWLYTKITLMNFTSEFWLPISYVGASQKDLFLSVYDILCSSVVVVEKAGWYMGSGFGQIADCNMWQVNVTLSTISQPLFLFLVSSCSLPAVDPMGEEHYARRASWIPPFMVVVGLMCFLYILYMLSICLCVS